ncbi:unnamed protein product [Linum tenue]|uniref:Uncharacterized protein n=1 Tax=Linum tenue TaxID=586396 RepID=A0AAV0K1U3_9ROSI|nr:unnamed protein product [Linum tenue]
MVPIQKRLISMVTVFLECHLDDLSNLGNKGETHHGNIGEVLEKTDDARGSRHSPQWLP